jgi:isocitrate/isopropylmalate dehydrogenase
MMLDWLGETAAAASVNSAVEAVLAEGRVRTPDMGGSARTTDITDAIIAKIVR